MHVAAAIVMPTMTAATITTDANAPATAPVTSIRRHALEYGAHHGGVGGRQRLRSSTRHGDTGQATLEGGVGYTRQAQRGGGTDSGVGVTQREQQAGEGGLELFLA